MSIRSRRNPLIALAIGTLLLAGCGAQSQVNPAATGTAAQNFQATGEDAAGSAAGGPGQARPARANQNGAPGRARPDPLNLTGDQQAQLKAILEKYRPQGDREAHEQEREEFGKLLQAEPLDEAALRAWLEARKSTMAGQLPTQAAMLGEIRAVLTDTQRQQFAQLPAPPQGMPGEGGKPQRQGGGAPGLLPPPPPPLPPAQPPQQGQEPPGHAAIAAFMQSGDQAGLLSSLQADFNQVNNVDDRIKAIAALSPAERARLAAGPPGGMPPF